LLPAAGNRCSPSWSVATGEGYYASFVLVLCDPGMLIRMSEATEVVYLVDTAMCDHAV